MIRKSIKERIITFFFIHPTKRLRVRHIERDVKVPLPSAIRYAKELEREGILKREQEAGVTLYSANRTNPTYLLEKRLWNLRTLHTSGLITHISQEYARPTIILFGSFARGEDTETSDVDLCILTPSTRRITIPRKHWTFARNVHILQHRTLHEIENKELANNIVNGIVLEGFIEAFR